MTAGTQSESISTADEIFFVCGRNSVRLRSAPDFSADGRQEKRRCLSILLKISVLRCLLVKPQNPCEIFGKKTRNDFCAIVGRQTGKGVVVKTANSTRSCFDDERSSTYLKYLMDYFFDYEFDEFDEFYGHIIDKLILEIRAIRGGIIRRQNNT